jgi:acyl transferase domain-containing protein
MNSFVTTLNSPLTPRVFAYGARVYNWEPDAVRHLRESDSLFRQVLAQCDREIHSRLGWSLQEELARGKDTFRLNKSDEHFEPTLTALQIAQTEVWRERGLRPEAVVALSGGEFTAAYAAGTLSLEDAILVACGWARIHHKRLGLGRMTTAQCTLEQAHALQQAVAKPVHVAGEFSATRTVLSAEMEAMADAKAVLDSWGVAYHDFPTEFAYHSPVMELASLREEFLQNVRGLSPRQPTLPVYSASCGGRLEGARFDGPHFWNVVQAPAMYRRAIQQLLNDGHHAFLEITLVRRLHAPIEEEARARGISATVLSSLESLCPAQPSPQSAAIPSDNGARSSRRKRWDLWRSWRKWFQASRSPS